LPPLLCLFDQVVITTNAQLCRYGLHCALLEALSCWLHSCLLFDQVVLTTDALMAGGTLVVEGGLTDSVPVSFWSGRRHDQCIVGGTLVGSFTLMDFNLVDSFTLINFNLVDSFTLMDFNLVDSFTLMDFNLVDSFTLMDSILLTHLHLSTSIYGGWRRSGGLSCLCGLRCLVSSGAVFSELFV
jgi:hypothetical protein